MKTINLAVIFNIMCVIGYSNNIIVSNTTLTGLDDVNNFTLVQFDMSWENSWRISNGPANWDAAWVFIKYRVSGGNWQHATLNYVDGTAANDGHSQPAGSIVQAQGDGVGAFIYRSTEGSGTANFSGIQMRWNYGADGVADGDLVDVQVFAIEMVYVPQATYKLGGTGSETNKFYYYPFTTISYTVASEGAISIGTTNGNLAYSGGGDGLGALDLPFPKGYNAFYCMKYEASHQQYVDFFNTLTDAQKGLVDITGAGGKNDDAVLNMNTIVWSSGNATTTTPERALNYVSLTLLLSYLDWSGLRPMTELEYEKSCRGTSNKVADEYAWGTTNRFIGTYTFQNIGKSNEKITDLEELVGHASSIGVGGDLYRCGIFAASSVNHTREETGATYYGIMEMTGNVYEPCITIGNPTGRAFTGAHGDGKLTSINNGNHNVANWSINGFGMRGGSFLDYNTANSLRTSSRSFGLYTNTVPEAVGIRGVRSAQ